MPETPVPFRIRDAGASPPGWPPDVLPNQVITAAHINAIKGSVYAWPGDVDGQNHTLRNVNLVGATGVLADPTTTPGDLIARGAATIGRFPIGTAGQVLTVDLAQPAKLRWATPATAPVVSVFGRVGAIAPQAGDYTAAMVTGALADPLTTKGDLIARGAATTGRMPVGIDGQVLRVDSSQVFGLRWGGESVPSVFGRTGPIVAQAGDYTAAQVTNAISSLGSYPDPAWIPSLGWTKIIGAPATYPPGAHTHDAAAIVSGVIATARLGTGVADATVYLRGDGTWAAAGSGGGGVISVFGRAGAVVAQAGDYTAAMVTGAVADPTAARGDLIVRNDLNALVRLPLGANGQVLQADNTLTTGMKWTTITGAVQTPWVTDIDAANYQLLNVRRLGIGTSLPAYQIDVVGDVNYTGTLRKNGAAVAFMSDPTTTKGDLIARGAAAIDRLPAGTNGQVLTADNTQALGVKWAAAGGSQTPWTSDIDGAGFTLKNVGKIGVGASSPGCNLDVAGLVRVQSPPTYPTSGIGMEMYYTSGVGVFQAVDRTSGTVYMPMCLAPTGGNVIIGGTVPGAKLTVTGGALQVQGGGFASAGVGVEITYASNIGYIQAFDRTGSAWKQLNIAGYSVYLASNGGAIVLQQSGGNVGINTASPSAPLEVVGSIKISSAAQQTSVNVTGSNTDVGVSIQNTGTGGRQWQLLSSAGSSSLGQGAFNIWDNGFGSRLSITAGGNVGLTNGSPNYRLDVSGDCNITGTYRVNGTPIGAGGGVTTKNVVTGSRAFGTTYQNNTGKPMFLTVAVLLGTGNTYAQLLTDAGSPPSAIASATTNTGSASATLTVSAWVLPGHYYQTTAPLGGTLSAWNEWT